MIIHPHGIEQARLSYAALTDGCPSPHMEITNDELVIDLNLGFTLRADFDAETRSGFVRVQSDDDGEQADLDDWLADETSQAALLFPGVDTDELNDWIQNLVDDLRGFAYGCAIAGIDRIAERLADPFAETPAPSFPLSTIATLIISLEQQAVGCDEEAERLSDVDAGGNLVPDRSLEDALECAENRGSADGIRYAIKRLEHLLSETPQGSPQAGDS